MANTIDITLRGRDETGKAFDNAKKRVNDYGKSVDSARKPSQNMAEVLEKMGGAANGGATSIARLGQAFGGMSGPMAQAGAVLGSFLVGWQAGTKLYEMGLFGRSGTKQMESDFKFLEAGYKRIEKLRSARAAADVAAIGAEDAGPAAALRKVIVQMNAEADAAEQSIKDAGANLAKAQQQYDLMLPTLNREKVTQAKEAIDLANQELKVAQDIAKLRKEAADNIIKAATAAAVKQAEEMQSAMDIGTLNQEISAFQKSTELAEHNLKEIADAIAGLNDPSVMKIAQDALKDVGRGKEAGEVKAEAVRQAQEEAQALDKLTEIQRKKRDPEERDRMRNIARERDRMEKQLERVRDREKAGRPLATWEKELLAGAGALDRGVGQRQAQRQAARDIRDRKQESDAITAGVNSSKLGQMADDIKKLLSAAGRG